MESRSVPSTFPSSVIDFSSLRCPVLFVLKVVEVVEGGRCRVVPARPMVVVGRLVLCTRPQHPKDLFIELNRSII